MPFWSVFEDPHKLRLESRREGKFHTCRMSKQKLQKDEIRNRMKIEWDADRGRAVTEMVHKGQYGC